MYLLFQVMQNLIACGAISFAVRIDCSTFDRYTFCQAQLASPWKSEGAYLSWQAINASAIIYIEVTLSSRGSWSTSRVGLHTTSTILAEWAFASYCLPEGIEICLHRIEWLSVRWRPADCLKLASSEASPGKPLCAQMGLCSIPAALLLSVKCCPSSSGLFGRSPGTPEPPRILTLAGLVAVASGGLLRWGMSIEPQPKSLIKLNLWELIWRRNEGIVYNSWGSIWKGI